MNVVELRDMLSMMIDNGLGEYPVLIEIDTESGPYSTTYIQADNDVYVQKYNFGEDVDCCVIHGVEQL